MGMHQRQFLFSKTLTTSWPSATQIQHWTRVLGSLRSRLLNLPGDATPNYPPPSPHDPAGA